MDGGGERQLTSYPGIDCCPSWSPDGSRLVYASSRPTREFYEVPRQGGEPRFIHRTNKLASVAEWAPDGKWLAFPEDGLWRIPVTGGDVELLLEGQRQNNVRWSPDGGEIYYLGEGERLGTIWSLCLEDRSERLVTELSGRRGSLGRSALATDGQYIYFTWKDLGDIWAMDVVER